MGLTIYVSRVACVYLLWFGDLLKGYYVVIVIHISLCVSTNFFVYLWNNVVCIDVVTR